MAKKRGNELLLEFENLASPGTFVEFAALGNPKISFSQDKDEVTRPPAGSAAAASWWSEFLEGGKRAVSVSGDYSAVGADAEELIAHAFFSGGGELNGRIVDPTLGTITAVWAINSFERSAETELTGSISLTSNGDVTRVPA